MSTPAKKPLAAMRSRLTAAGRRRAIRGRLGTLPEGGYSPAARQDDDATPAQGTPAGRIPRQGRPDSAAGSPSNVAEPHDAGS